MSFTITPTKTSLKCSFQSPLWNRLIFTGSFLCCGNVLYNVTATLFPRTLLGVGNKLLARWQLDHESLVSVACPFTWSVAKEVTSTLLLSHPLGCLAHSTLMFTFPPLTEYAFFSLSFLSQRHNVWSQPGPSELRPPLNLLVTPSLQHFLCHIIIIQNLNSSI